MFKVFANPLRPALHAAQVTDGSLDQLLRGACRYELGHGTLQVPVGPLVRIEFRAVAREIEDHDTPPVGHQPDLHRLGMMHPQLSRIRKIFSGALRISLRMKSIRISASSAPSKIFQRISPLFVAVKITDRPRRLPQQIGHLQLVRDHLAHQQLLRQIEHAPLTRLTTTRRIVQGFHSVLFVSLADVEHARAAQSAQLGNFLVRATRLAKPEHLHSSLVPRIWARQSHIGRSRRFDIRASPQNSRPLIPNQ